MWCTCVSRGELSHQYTFWMNVKLDSERASERDRNFGDIVVLFNMEYSELQNWATVLIQCGMYMFSVWTSRPSLTYLPPPLSKLYPTIQHLLSPTTIPQTAPPPPLPLSIIINKKRYRSVRSDPPIPCVTQTDTTLHTHIWVHIYFILYFASGCCRR